MRIHAVRLCLVAVAFMAATGMGQDVQFHRGDCNADTYIDLSDPIYLLGHLFVNAGFPLACEDLGDSNDDGALDLADVVFILDYLFDQGAAPAFPFHRLGCDPTPDGLACLAYRDNIACGDPPEDAIIIDHTATDVSLIPLAFIEAAKNDFRIYYGHTSHGSQIMSGIRLMEDGVFNYNDGEGSLSIIETGGDLGNPNSTEWANRTRSRLDEAGNDRNVVMWSWCGQASGRSEAMMQTDYLDLMDTLEQAYPDVKFIYMTGHLDGTGPDGNLHIRNEQIRDYCRANGKILFDFADIERYDPEGRDYLALDANDNCDYRDPDEGSLRNWADEWCAAHPGECGACSCAHSKCLNCQMKGRAFWWMMARMAGWNGR